MFGLSATTVGTDGYWGVTETTAGDQLTLLRTVLDPDGPLGAARSAYLAGLMADVVDGQDWDVGAAGRGGESVVLKNGWDIEGDVWNVNSVGRIGDDVTLAVLSTGSATQADGVALVERAARLARTALPAG